MAFLLAIPAVVYYGAGALAVVAGAAGALWARYRPHQTALRVELDRAEAQAAEIRRRIGAISKELGDVDTQLQDAHEDQARLEDIRATQSELVQLLRLQEAAYREVCNTMARLGAADAAAQARAKQLNLDITTEFNFAVCGFRGVGKSTLVNTLRGLHAGAVGAAHESAGAQGNQVATSYGHPRAPWLKLVDIPGGDVPGHDRDTYCDRHGLDLFDAIIVAYSGRLREMDMKILEYAHTHKKVVFLVYTKAEQGLFELQGKVRTPPPIADVINDLRGYVRQGIIDDINRDALLSPRLRQHLLAFADRVVLVDALVVRMPHCFPHLMLPADGFLLDEGRLVTALAQATQARLPAGSTADELARDWVAVLKSFARP